MVNRKLILAVALAVGSMIQAAEISWTVDLLDSLADFSTEGSLVEAVNWGEGVDGTVNGIKFIGKEDDGSDLSTSHFSTEADRSTVDDRLFEGANWPSSADATEVNNSKILDSVIRDNARKGGEYTIKLTGLIPNRDYIVQLFVSDEGRDDNDGDWMTVDGGKGNELQSPYLLGSEYQTSTVFTGTFKADGTTQSFTVFRTDNDATSDKTIFLNASQLRILPDVECALGIA